MGLSLRRKEASLITEIDFSTNISLVRIVSEMLLLSFSSPYSEASRSVLDCKFNHMLTQFWYQISELRLIITFIACGQMFS